MENNSPSDSKVFYRPDIWYSLTICPNDKRQYCRDGDRLHKCHSYMYEKTIAWPQHGIIYWLQPELSEPRKSGFDKNGQPTNMGGRYHWHGMIKFTTNKAVLYWLLYGLSYLMIDCILDIDTIADMETWKSYCEKQKMITKFKPLKNIDIDEIGGKTEQPD